MISTGAVLPDGTDAILRLEEACLDGDLVTGLLPESGTHIRRAGEDAQQGQLLAHRGAIVAPGVIGLAAACGYDELLVLLRPSVRVVVTGEELLRRGVSGGGRIRDALGPMLPHLISQLGGTVRDVRHVSDREAGVLATALLPQCGQAAEASIVVVTGSTSVGPSDHLRPLLRELGADVIVDGVACRPGHPQLQARLGPSRRLVGLPGNPFAAFVAAHTLLAPLLAGLVGRGIPRLLTAALAGDAPVLAGRTVIVPVRWDGATARVMGDSRPASLQGAAQADALADYPRSAGRQRTGGQVGFIAPAPPPPGARIRWSPR